MGGAGIGKNGVMVRYKLLSCMPPRMERDPRPDRWWRGMPLWRIGRANVFASFGIVLSRFPKPGWEEILEGWRRRPRAGIVLPPGAMVVISRGPRPGGGWHLIATPEENRIIHAEGDDPQLFFLTPRGLHGREVRAEPLEEPLRHAAPSPEEIREGTARLMAALEDWDTGLQGGLLRHCDAEELAKYEMAGPLLAGAGRRAERAALDLLARLHPWP